MLIEPEKLTLKPVTHLINVLLPAPFDDTKLAVRPLYISRLKSDKIGCPFLYQATISFAYRIYESSAKFS